MFLLSRTAAIYLYCQRHPWCRHITLAVGTLRHRRIHLNYFFSSLLVWLLKLWGKVTFKTSTVFPDPNADKYTEGKKKKKVHTRANTAAFKRFLHSTQYQFDRAIADAVAALLGSRLPSALCYSCWFIASIRHKKPKRWLNLPYSVSMLILWVNFNQISFIIYFSISNFRITLHQVNWYC